MGGGGRPAPAAAAATAAAAAAAAAATPAAPAASAPAAAAADDETATKDSDSKREDAAEAHQGTNSSSSSNCSSSSSSSSANSSCSSSSSMADRDEDQQNDQNPQQQKHQVQQQAQLQQEQQLQQQLLLQEQQQEQQQHRGSFADGEAFPSLEEQNRQLQEARASMQQQQERKRLQQQQQKQQQQQQQEAEEAAADAEDLTAADDACCSYCGVSGAEVLMRCDVCSRFFCNSAVGKTRKSGAPSHVLQHVIRSKHREALRCTYTAGDTKLECFICGVKNVLQLGMLISEAQNVVVIVCRDRCYASGVLEENGWNPTEWQPLIDNKALASWLARPLTNAERARALPVSREEIEEMERKWMAGDNAISAELGIEGGEPLPWCSVIYEDGVSYQRTYAPLIAAEADVEKKQCEERVATSCCCAQGEPQQQQRQQQQQRSSSSSSSSSSR
ncbi:hypothetical protein, conserved [Eimeria acervulina]|uniref:Upf1 domain-containing protein n=1 Tax=Eimeria acervulina TaxID=5801 RepID=U6GER8_EIMAC|nr:hypothetical protein, conserved [Eimeria acervulina]CDI78761.1 hypothetical protein, conserved [Eimeria acervulina]